VRDLVEAGASGAVGRRRRPRRAAHSVDRDAVLRASSAGAPPRRRSHGRPSASSVIRLCWSCTGDQRPGQPETQARHAEPGPGLAKIKHISVRFVGESAQQTTQTTGNDDRRARRRPGGRCGE
jgi:hypothetical protein